MRDQQEAITHVFISQGHLISYGGSEIVTLELAEHFAAAGTRVTIGTWSVGPPMMGHLLGRPNISYFDLDDPQLTEVLALDPPQLAWVHHQLVPEYLLLHSEGTRFVFNHMSSVHPLEMSWSATVEARLAVLHLYNSQEAIDAHRSNGSIAQFDAARIKIFPNPAPATFERPPLKPRSSESELTLGIVSNHVPQEILELVDSPPSGLSFKLISSAGWEPSPPTRVTAETFGGLDGVITIGKTVQYALIAGLPVYCYDKFGGPGWLAPENFNVCEYNNFSGRGFSRKQTADIASELQRGFGDAYGFAQDIKRSAVDRFRLSVAIDEVIAAVQGELDPAPVLTPVVVEAHLRQQKVVSHYARNWLRLSRKS